MKSLFITSAIAIVISGIAVFLVWKLGLGLSDAVYEIFPGMAAGFIVYLISTMFNQQKKI